MKEKAKKVCSFNEYDKKTFIDNIILSFKKNLILNSLEGKI
jgi:hypothetical protein